MMNDNNGNDSSDDGDNDDDDVGTQTNSLTRGLTITQSAVGQPQRNPWVLRRWDKTYFHFLFPKRRYIVDEKHDRK